MTPTDPDPEAAWLHAGGTPGCWGNLGLWPAPGERAVGCDYATAATALAMAVGHAAGLMAGQRVLSVACGEGAELALWRSAFGVAEARGVERDPSRVARAQAAGEDVRLGQGIAATDAGFDAVLCVDAAYHLSPREPFLRDALRALKSGGALAYTDLLLEDRPSSRWRRAVLQAGAKATGLTLAGIGSGLAQCERLRALGFEDVRLQRLDEAVLGGFVRFVRAQRRRLGTPVWQPAWRRIAVTAALIPLCRSAGLGYGLLSARRSAAGVGRLLPSCAGASA